ncbi:MAG: c-type cytochrome [Ardenticatenaceae bacterium]|nr:c-type cytochrome [Ardenticatenaceae bacterium]MCB9446327.1 c-type cytochrome [Ardenticatenaceae bacterium]
MKMTFKTIVIGGVIVFFAVVLAAVFIPSLIWKPEQTVIAHNYTTEEERGRELFYSNGCNYCHTQYVREEDTAMGPVSQGGNYIFDNPMILGSERTGPDLSYLGRKRSEAWEIAHLQNPRQYSPLSIMPSFEFLPEEDLQAIAAYLFALGDRVAQERMILPPLAYAGQTDPIDYPAATPVPPDQSQGWANWEAADLQAGKEIYVENCLTCHGCAGNGLGSYGGTMSVTPANFKQEPYRSMPDDQWFWHVSEGVPGTLMPTWKTSLTEEQCWQVIRYIQQVFAHPIMRDPDEGDPSGAYANLTNPVPLTVETLEEGKAIFIRECMVCHGDAGRGDGPYADGLQPPPPDFGDGSYGTLDNPSYTDSDYFWRISEGLPWSAMPAWKSQYSEEDRWKLVHYIRVNFTQTEARLSLTADQVYPDIYLTQTMPETVSETAVIEGNLTESAMMTPSFERGKQLYLTTCAQCHGLSGQGDGWNGQYLDVSPANFTDLNMRGMTDGDYFARVSLGVQNSAMPTWGEFLPAEQRWDVIKYIQDAFVDGRPTLGSLYDQTIASNVITLSQDNWLGAGNVISTTHGADIYQSNCATCHGDQGQGDGPGAVNLASGAPAAYPQDLPFDYIFWRTLEGVPDSIMPAFQSFLSEADIWDVSTYVESMLNPQSGGG